MAHLLESFEADAAAVGMMTGDRAPPGVNAISKNLSVRQGYGCLMSPQCLVQSSVIRIFFYTKSYKTIKRPKTVSTFFYLVESAYLPSIHRLHFVSTCLFVVKK